MNGRSVVAGASLVAALAAVMAFGKSLSPSYRSDAQTATLDVCVLNTKKLPVSKKRISNAEEYLTKTLRAYANIDVRITDEGVYDGDLNTLLFSTGPYKNPHDDCPSPHDIVLLFTRANNVISVPEGSNKGPFLSGFARFQYGYAVILGSFPSNGPKEYLSTTVHEVGHLLGLEDSLDSTDVMYGTLESVKGDRRTFGSIASLRNQSKGYLLRDERKERPKTLDDSSPTPF